MSAAAALALAACVSNPPQPAQPQPAPEQTPTASGAGQAQPPAHEQAAQSAPQIRSDAPKRYVVRKGDTLWDLASKFLKSPWRWPEIWYLNPDIHNPHLIYPGDVITLTYTASGKPQLHVTRGPQAPKTVKVEPRVRVEPIGNAIPTIPYDAVAAFLASPRVVEAKRFESAPYVLRAVNDARLVVGANQKVYVSNLPKKPLPDYQIVHKGKALRDPKSGKLLGYEAIAVGEAKILKDGDPGTALVQKSSREVRRGDYLLPPPASNFRPYFTPQAPSQQVSGQILSVYNNAPEIGQYQIVTIDVGKSQGIKVGDVLAVYQAGDQTRDPETGQRVRLPPQRAGVLMAFRVYDHVSYALVMRATQSIHVTDTVRNP
ncbi:MAG TPA: LysM peptidoglycan-binding domain-containing protein [Gammaproteobacteria bacterium]|nr:LysM peptidoglycan-binding domain-containing protein [Gammaproteobacteria bacterium]